MSSWKNYIPDGTRDILFQEYGNKVYIEDSLRKVFLSRGFLEISTPTIEFYDVFDEEGKWIEQEKMYKLFDNHGRILVLRPDITIPIGRVAGTKLKDSYYPLRLCYSANVFRVNESWNGRRSEFTQSGVEIIGIDNIKADVEVIVTAIQALLECGIKDFKIELGQVKFFKGIIEDLNIENGDIEKIRNYIENKNFGTLKDFLESRSEVMEKEVIKALNELPRLFGDINVISKGRELTDNKNALKALDNIEIIYTTLENMGLSKYLSIDLGMVHHIDYYTGLIFRGYIDGAGDNILFGGRYDGLIKKLRENVPATGFAINVDSILDLFTRQGQKYRKINADYIVYYKDEVLHRANELSSELRKQGSICELSLFETFDETRTYASKKKIRYILAVDEKEILIYDSSVEQFQQYRTREVK